jgi:hypothetical protein
MKALRTGDENFTPICAVAAALLASLNVAAHAQEIPDLTDGFVRVDLEGAGGFDYLTEHVGAARLHPEYDAIVRRTADYREQLVDFSGRQLPEDYVRVTSGAPPKEAGEAYVVREERLCNSSDGSVPLEPNSAAFFMTQTDDMVVVTREGAGIRRIYLDRNVHPANLEPSAMGHSFGYYENGDLVVETVGLTESARVTAGGYRRPETQLTERFSLSDDGGLLTIRYIWTDPEVYIEPHSYTISYERLTPPYNFAVESWCDASDPETGYSIVIPEQNF